MRSSKSGQSTSWVAGSSVIPIRVVFARLRRDAADETLALRPEPDARRVDDERDAVEPLAAGEAEDGAALGLDGKGDAGQRRQRGAAGSGAIDERPAGDARCVRRAVRRRCGRRRARPRHRAGAVLRPERARLAAQGLQQAPAVEPALARAPEGARRRGRRCAATGSAARGRPRREARYRPLPPVCRARFSARIAAPAGPATIQIAALLAGRSPGARRRPRGARRCRAGKRCRTGRCGCSRPSRTAAGSRRRRAPRPSAGRSGPARPRARVRERPARREDGRRRTIPSRRRRRSPHRSSAMPLRLPASLPANASAVAAAICPCPKRQSGTPDWRGEAYRIAASMQAGYAMAGALSPSSRRIAIRSRLPLPLTPRSARRRSAFLRRLGVPAECVRRQAGLAARSPITGEIGRRVCAATSAEEAKRRHRPRPRGVLGLAPGAGAAARRARAPARRGAARRARTTSAGSSPSRPARSSRRASARCRR